MAMVTRKDAVRNLSLMVPLREMGEFFSFLMQGFQMVVPTGCSVNELLCDHFCIDREYVLGRITTVFLNGKAIDDLNAATIKEGSRLTLSAAMPGLVGATMRRGGFYAAMRGSITYSETEETTLRGRGVIVMKLFNLLLPELGPGFLKLGIGVVADDVTEFFAQRHSSFWEVASEIILDGIPVEPERLKSGLARCAGEAVRLSITCSEATVPPGEPSIPKLSGCRTQPLE